VFEERGVKKGYEGPEGVQRVERDGEVWRKRGWRGPEKMKIVLITCSNKEYIVMSMISRSNLPVNRDLCKTETRNSKSKDF